MKNVVLFCFLISLISINSFSCRGTLEKKAEESKNKEVIKDKEKYTVIQWKDTAVNFGTIKMGEKAVVKFNFKNTGDHPLYLLNVQAGCGCTVPSYTQGAILPNREGEVVAEFDSKRASSGEIRKTIAVTTNTKNNMYHTLIFTGEVKGVR